MKKCIIRKIVLKTVNNLLSQYGDNIDHATEVLKVWISKLDLITEVLKSAMDKIEDKKLTDAEISEILSQLESAIDAIVREN